MLRREEPIEHTSCAGLLTGDLAGNLREDGHLSGVSPGLPMNKGLANARPSSADY
jgi:hypothetical protein